MLFFSVDKEKLKEIMKEVGSNNYDKGLNKVEFTRVSTNISIIRNLRLEFYPKYGRQDFTLRSAGSIFRLRLHRFCNL